MARVLGEYGISELPIDFNDLIYEKDVLINRIQAVTLDRLAKGEKGIMALPSVTDVEATHVVIPRNSFMPYVPIVTQYIRSGKTSGKLGWDSTIRFNLESQGDFLWDAFLHLNTNSVRTNISATGLPPLTEIGGNPTGEEAAPFGVGLEAEVPAIPWYPYSYWMKTYRYIDGAGNTIPYNPQGGITPVQNYTYFSNNLVHRLFTSHELRIGNNTLDTYNNNTDTFYLNKRIGADKKEGYYRCIGQEVPLTAYSDNYGVISDTDTARRQIFICNGPQTPKLEQPGQSLIYPYKFDMCESPASAMPVLQIPSTRREIVSTIGSQDSCIYTTTPIFLETTVYLYNLDGGGQVTTSQSQIFKAPFPITDSIANTSNFFGSCNMYVNNIYMDSNARDIFIRRIPLVLSRFHLYSTVPNVSTGAKYKMSSFKWGLEYMFFGVIPVDNLTTPTAWDIYQLTGPVGFSKPRVINMATGLNAAYTSSWFDGDPNNALALGVPNVVTEYNYNKCFPVLTNMQITLQNQNYTPGVDALPMVFYDSYTGVKLGGGFIATSVNPGYGMVSFSFYPGGTAPYGYFRVSRAAEFYLTPTLFGQSPTSNMVVDAIAINFLLIENGTLLIRFP